MRRGERKHSRYLLFVTFMLCLHSLALKSLHPFDEDASKWDTFNVTEHDRGVRSASTSPLKDVRPRRTPQKCF